MSELSTDAVRVLVAPCGHIAGIDVTTEVPGFCRDIDEAEEDIAHGFTERRMTLDEAKAAAMDECDHDPEWGVA